MGRRNFEKPETWEASKSERRGTATAVNASTDASQDTQPNGDAGKQSRSPEGGTSQASDPNQPQNLLEATPTVSTPGHVQATVLTLGEWTDDPKKAGTPLMKARTQQGNTQRRAARTISRMSEGYKWPRDRDPERTAQPVEEVGLAQTATRSRGCAGTVVVQGSPMFWRNKCGIPMNGQCSYRTHPLWKQRHKKVQQGTIR